METIIANIFYVVFVLVGTAAVSLILFVAIADETREFRTILRMKRLARKSAA